jgi:2,4-dienoyl-CoA reductase-like NADH-dependent reductase (Old Yellow Enzyme family)
MQNILFEPLETGKRTIPNRFVAQGMEANDGENGGCPSARTLDRYRLLAKGNWGIVVAEAISITETSIARVNGLILNKKNLDGFKRLVEAFKKENPGGIFLLQLTHSGEQSGNFPPERVAGGSEKTCLAAPKEGCRYLSADEIEGVRDRFVSAALLAEEAGADGIDFKLCHGYLGAEILRPSNVRPDKWGGSLENRTRLLREGVGELKGRIKSANFILGSRLSLFEGIRGGCGTGGPDEIVEDLGDMLEVVRLIDKLGMDYVNVSAGIPALTGAITRPTEPSKYLALHHLRYTKTVKELIVRENRKLKVIGSAYSSHKEEAPKVMEEMLSKQYTDLCGFGRQIFADPFTPKKIKNGEAVNWCRLCSGCTKLMISQNNDGCIIYNDYYRELFRVQNSSGR